MPSQQNVHIASDINRHTFGLVSVCICKYLINECVIRGVNPISLYDCYDCVFVGLLMQLYRRTGTTLNLFLYTNTLSKKWMTSYVWLIH